MPQAGACFVILVALTISSMIITLKARVIAKNIGVKIDGLLGNRKDLTFYARIFNVTKTVARGRYYTGKCYTG